MRYETPGDRGGEKDETRREYNARFGVESPDHEIVEGGRFLWDCFSALTRFRATGVNGPEPISPRDIREWREMTGTILRREECNVLIAMDQAYRVAWSEEMASQAAAKQDQATAKQRPVTRRRRARGS